MRSLILWPSFVGDAAFERQINIDLAAEYGVLQNDISSLTG
jgi:hypothetical protein